MFSDFFSLLYPNLCCACGDKLLKSEKAICLKCKYEFPYLGLTHLKDNSVTKVFWGRVPLEYGISLIAFNKGHKIQNVLHEIKYNNHTTAAEELGEMIGEIINSFSVSDVDFLIPVPLHPKKLKTRGYNQAELIANGISLSTQIPVLTNTVIRNAYTETQTKKRRMERWDNVAAVFELNSQNNLTDKHVLIVDDVLTTGATLEACANVILKAGIKKLSIATVACVI